ncbi:fructose-bisphosphate aldolase [Candidatus Woesearchaeota archaeon]|nr:fructose-bisphosphate aldolase [Candidatus Woesearchaeota archaeon]
MLFFKKRSIIKDGKFLILAYDQGFEHGPADFNLENVNPQRIFDIALKGDYTAVAVQAGIAEKYYLGENRKVPLIVKLNAKDRFDNYDPVSLSHTSVKYAKKLGALGVGYTIYLGASREQEMFREFGMICEEAKRLGLLVVCWMYPRGPSIKNDLDTDIIAYGARVAMELGADVVKVKYNGDPEGLKWIIKCAGRARVVVAGGKKIGETDFFSAISSAIASGASGVAIGRNVWQDSDPESISKKLSEIVFGVSKETN